MKQGVYRFSDFELDESLLELRHCGRPVEIQAKPFFLIAYLIRYRHRLVTRAELSAALWPNAVVSAASLTTALHEARRALGDNSGRRLIATVRGRGYRFLGAIEESGAAAVDGPEAATPVPAPDSEKVSALPAAPASPFADRVSEMEQLRATLAAARAGERRVVLLQGPPGIGKTRTASELAIEAVRAGFAVHVGRTHEGDGAPPFWPWIQVLRSIGEARPVGELSAAAGVAASDLVQLVPELRVHLGEPAERAALAPEQARFRMFDGVTGFLRNVARACPLLLVLDDLHWADDASLALLVFLARALSEAPLAIVGTHRPLGGSHPARERALGRVLREPGTASIALSGLGAASVEVILGQSLGRRPSAELVERVRTITGGNPFFVAETARLLATRDREALDPTGSLPIPDRLRDTVRIRISECSRACQQIFRAGSVIGARFALPLLRRAIDLSPGELVDALADAERADLVYRDTAPGSYRFAHGVVREILYEELGAAERRRLHGAVGKALEELSDPDPTPRLAELAHHFSEAALPERALHYARRAAARAGAVFAHQEQADHCRRGLEALELLDPPDPLLRCELRVELCEALAAAHAPVESVENAAEEAVQLARRLDRPALQARAAQVRARYVLDKDTVAFVDPARAVPLLQRLLPPLEEALVALGDGEHAELRVSTLLLLARLHATAGDTARSTALIDQAEARSAGDADPAQRCAILGARYEVTDGLERPAESLALADGIVRHAQRADRPEQEVYGHVARASLCLQACDREDADASGAQIERLAREHAIADIFILRAMWRSLVAQIDGRLDDAERETRETLQLSRRFNYQPERAAALVTLHHWWLSLLRGRPMATFSQLRAYTSAQPGVLFSHVLLARLHAELGHRRDASAELGLLGASALQQLPRDYLWLFIACLSAETCALIDDTERARALFDSLEPYAELAATALFIGSCIGSVARPLGALAATLGLWTECDDLFDLALTSNEALHAPPLVVWTQIDYARVLLRHPHPRRRAKGERMLGLAARAAAPLGMSDALSRARPAS